MRASCAHVIFVSGVRFLEFGACDVEIPESWTRTRLLAAYSQLCWRAFGRGKCVLLVCNEPRYLALVMARFIVLGLVDRAARLLGHRP